MRLLFKVPIWNMTRFFTPVSLRFYCCCCSLLRFFHIFPVFFAGRVGVKWRFDSVFFVFNFGDFLPSFSRGAKFRSTFDICLNRVRHLDLKSYTRRKVDFVCGKNCYVKLNLR
uniref:(northern house mosquito) hypothetical protein n=1 Tax=Culex pipiens TaxID=7175 RepID=A0A8D8JTH6_CULPI